MSDWINIEHRLPDRGVVTICWFRNDYEFSMIINGSLSVYIDSEWVPDAHNEVTHWMPLPEPPK